MLAMNGLIMRILAGLVALLMAAGLVGAPGATDAAALPGVGDAVAGFVVREISRLDMADADVVLFEHEKTGALVLYIANPDTNRAFNIAFRTPVADDTGLPHVFEHATLNGSEKYPSQSLFFNLIYQTYNTYMNAGTYDVMTAYPVASLSEAQLLKYADFYTDSVLHPLIMTEESIFSEEAWRYSLTDPQGELTIAGTVYSEMQGAYDLQSAALLDAYGTLFPGARIANCFGGKPEDIPDLTWERLREYHDLYYHPSNSLTCLYGKYDDYAAFLTLLDGCFSAYERRTFDFSEPDYRPIAEPRTARFEYGVEAGSDTANGATAYYGFACGDPAMDELLQLDMLAYVFSDQSSPFIQGLVAALPAAVGDCYLEIAGPERAVIFTATGVNAGEEEIFRGVVDDAIATVARGGFEPDVVDAVAATIDMDELLIMEGSAVGVYLSERYAYSWAALDDLDAFALPGTLHDIAAQNAALTEAAEKYLSGNARTALTITVPAPGLKEAQDQALADRLAAVKAGMTEAELRALVDAAAALANGPADDASRYVAQLQAATAQTLPEEVREYPVRDEMGADGVRRVDATANVEGVGMVGVLLSAEGLAQEDLLWFKLYTQLIGSLDTEQYDRAVLAMRMSRYLYGGDLWDACYRDPDGSGFTPCLSASWISRDEDMGAAYELVYELLFRTELDDAGAIADEISYLRASMKQGIGDAPYQLQYSRALAAFDDMYAYNLYLNGLDYYAFLGEVEQLLADDPAAAVARLEAVQAFFHNRAGAVSAFSGSESSIANHRAVADGFFARMDSAPRSRAAYEFPPVAAAEALIVDSAVQYNLLYADYAALGLEGFTGDLDAVTALVSDGFLYPMLRDQYGAYGVIHYASESGVYIISYRDPNIKETFDVYGQLPGLLSELEVDQATLDGYIMSAYAYYAMTDGELSGANGAIMNALEGKGAQDMLGYMRALKGLTAEELPGYAGLYEALLNGVVSTSGGGAAIRKNADLYETILDPFAAK